MTGSQSSKTEEADTLNRQASDIFEKGNEARNARINVRVTVIPSHSVIADRHQSDSFRLLTSMN